MSDAITFGAWLKQRRKEQGMPADHLAERIGCSTVTLLKIESGNRRPSRQIALLLADSFDIPNDEREAFVTFARTGPVVTSVGSPTAPWRIAHLRHVNLPAVLTSLVGREVEGRATREQLLNPRTRLLTLTGPPGIGKTRLALDVASEVGENFQDGVYFVDLSPIIDPDLVLEAVGRVLGLKEESGRPMEKAILDHVRDRRTLLVLDNFEQVLDAAPIVVRLLEGCPWLKVLATSREALHVRGEKHLPVPPLALPDLSDLPPAHALDKYPAVKLFTERAAEAEYDFALTTENAQDVAAICVSLEGLPLAIELAAARARQLPPAEMRAALSGRLKLLTAGARDLPARQRTLRGAVEWSYNLLDEAEQRCFRRLGVFVGGYTVEAAKAVAGADDRPAADTVKNLEMLLNKNLITRHQGELRRFGMLETLREYALEQLAAQGEGEETRERHARYFLSFAQEGGEHYAGSEVVTWIRQVTTEYPNIREALAWFFEVPGRHGKSGVAVRQGGDPYTGESEERQKGARELGRVMLGADLCIALFPFWDAQHYLGEARDWYTRAAERIASFIERPGRSDAADAGQGASEMVLTPGKSVQVETAWATMLTGAAAMAFYQSDYGAARINNEKALGIRRQIDDRSGIAASLNNLGIAAIDQGDYEAAVTYLSESLAISRELGVHRKICSALSNLGIAETRQGNLAEARLHLEESLALARQVEDLQRSSDALSNLGVIARLEGDYVGARRLLDEAGIIYRQLEHKSGMVQVLIQLGFAARDENRYDESRSHFSAALAILTEVPKRIFIADCLEGLACLLGKKGSLERSARLFGAAERLREVTGVPLSQTERDFYDQFLAAVRRQVDTTRWDTAWAEGRAMTPEQAIEYALDEI